MNDITVLDFIDESNRIEGIHRPPTQAELEEFKRFISLEKITIPDLKKFVSVYAPGHVIRSKKGYNVRVGNYMAPAGGKYINLALEIFLHSLPLKTRYHTHIEYEKLHPFTDGNGRSGRAIWAWQTLRKYGALPEIGFLHSHYYDSLEFSR